MNKRYAIVLVMELPEERSEFVRGIFPNVSEQCYDRAAELLRSTGTMITQPTDMVGQGLKISRLVTEGVAFHYDNGELDGDLILRLATIPTARLSYKDINGEWGTRSIKVVAIETSSQPDEPPGPWDWDPTYLIVKTTFESYDGEETDNKIEVINAANGLEVDEEDVQRLNDYLVAMGHSLESVYGLRDLALRDHTSVQPSRVPWDQLPIYDIEQTAADLFVGPVDECYDCGTEYEICNHKAAPLN